MQANSILTEAIIVKLTEKRQFIQKALQDCSTELNAAIDLRNQGRGGSAQQISLWEQTTELATQKTAIESQLALLDELLNW